MTSRRAWIVRDLDRIGGPRALSTPVIAVSALVMLSITLVLDILAHKGSAGLWAVAGIGSMTITVVFLLIARATVLPVRPRPSRPVVALLVFAVGGAIKYLSMVALTARFGLPMNANRSALTAAAMMVVFMSLTTLIVCRVEEHRTALQQLTEERRRLLALGATFEERVAESERALQEQVHAQLDPAIHEIEAMLSDEISDEAGPAVDVLSHAVSEIVRPMSHRLGSAPSAASVAIEEAIYEPDDLHAAERHADIRDALHPAATGLICAVITASYLPRSEFSKAATAGAILTIALTIWLVGWAVRRLWPVRARVPMTVPALLVLLGLNAVVGFVVARVSVVLLALLFGGGPTVSRITTQAQGPSWAGLTATLVGFALSSLVLVQRRLEGAEQELRDVNTRLTIAVAQLRGQLWANRRNLSWILHGPVQSALVSAALEMSNPDLAGDDRSRIRQRIRQAIDTIDSTSKRDARVEHALGEIASVWEFSCQVTSVISPEASERLANDTTATMAVIEVVREGVGNATRHGGASAVDVHVDLTSHTFVHVTVRDNGSGLAPDAINGLGTSVLDEVAYQWRRTNAEPGTLLEADVPLQS